MTVAPHIQRVFDERSELQDKIVKLDAFIVYDPAFKTLVKDEQTDMREQLRVMVLYNNILDDRLERALPPVAE